MNEGMGKRARILLICIAAALIIGAVALSRTLTDENPWQSVLSELRRHGYTLDDTDFYNAGGFPDSCISGVLAGQDLSDAVKASAAAGFPSDVDAVGDLTLLLLTLENHDIVTVFIRDDHIELCFIQRLDSADVRPIS